MQQTKSRRCDGAPWPYDAGAAARPASRLSRDRWGRRYNRRLASEPLMQFVRMTAWAPRQRVVDAASVEAVTALQGAGATVVLLKGPVIAQWLYGDGDPRWYNDCDLLLPEAHLDAAGAVLDHLGYTRRPNAPDDPALLADVHSVVWTRSSDDAAVELHWTLVGLEAPPEQVWAALSANTPTIIVGGVDMLSLGEYGRALHLALHLAQHGRTSPQPLEDLRRGIARLGFDVGTGARELSARLSGDSAFGAGLRACPGGLELAGRLQLPPASNYWTLRADGAPRGAVRLRLLSDAAGWRERWVILREGLSRYREFSGRRSELKGLPRMRASASDLIAAFRALRRSR
jgi:hypothetical protein